MHSRRCDVRILLFLYIFPLHIVLCNTEEWQPFGKNSIKLHSNLKIFRKCHITTVVVKWITFPASRKNSNTFEDSLFNIFNSNDNFGTYSIETYSLYLQSGQTMITTNKLLINQKTPVKFANCFVYLYIPHKRTFQYLFSVLDSLQKRRRWPNHFLILQSLDIENPARIKFYTEQAPRSLARGLVLITNDEFDQFQILCLPCAWQGHRRYNSLPLFHDVKLSSFGNPRDAYLKTSLKIHSSLHLAPVLTDLSFLRFEYCNFMSTSRPSFIELPFTQCIPHILSQIFNFSVKSLYYKSATLFSAQTATPVDLENVAHENFRDKKMEWISYGLVNHHMRFIAFQRSIPFSASALMKPFDWQTWSLFLSSGVCLYVVTAVFAHKEKAAKFRDHTMISLTIIAGILNQGTSGRYRISGCTKIYQSKYLAGLWLTWTVMIIIFVNGYTGTIFAFLTSGTQPVWPTTLKDLVMDSDYCILSTEEISTFETGEAKSMLSYVRVEYIEPIMKGVSTEEVTEYLKLNQSLMFFNRMERDIIVEMLNKNPPVPASTNPYEIDEFKCVKFALLESHPEHDAVRLLYFLKNLEASDPIILPMYTEVIPPAISRNFFHEPFTRGVAALEQAGILQALKNYISKWDICFRVGRSEQFLISDSENENEEMPRFLRCIAEISSTVGNPSRLQGETMPSAISFQQIIGTFHVCFLVIFTSCFVLLVELHEWISRAFR